MIIVSTLCIQIEKKNQNCQPGQIIHYGVRLFRLTVFLRKRQRFIRSIRRIITDEELTENSPEAW